MTIGLEGASELAHLAPAFEIVVGICALFVRYDLGEVSKEQRKSTSGADDADGHIVLVEHENVTIEA